MGKGNDHKRNHYIPGCLLRRWATNNGKYDGVWVYDISKKKAYFANATGNRSFDFAVMDDLYVPVINGNRIVAMEKWFAGQESVLNSFVEQIHNRNSQIIIRKIHDVSKLCLALQSLKIRSPSDIELISAHIKSHPSIRELISASPERGVHQLTLENLIHIATEKANLYMPPELNFLCAPEDDVIMSDRPFIIDDRLEVRFIAVSSNTIVSYKKSDSGFRYRYIENTTQKFIDEINELHALNARKWIVARKKETIEKYSKLFVSDKYLDRKKKDHEAIEYMPIETLTQGWSLPEE